MIKATCLLALAVCLAAADNVVDDTELLFSLLVHRHGDRTPTEETLLFSTDPEELIELSAPYGFGQLTEVGKRTAYKLGEYIRNRYDEILSPNYNRSEVYIRSTDSTRAKMTILTALAAIYPPGPNSWSEDIHWTPVPYTTLPPRYDFNLYSINCPTYINVQTELMTSQPADMRRFLPVLEVISENLGMNITQTPALAYAVYDLFTAQISLGLPLTPELEAVFPEITEAAGYGLKAMAGNETYIALQAGPLLQQFEYYANQTLAGVDTPRLRIYSAHDLNVYSLLAVTQVEYSLGVPKYGSAYALELRRVKETGQVVVVPVYQERPGVEAIYLPVESCGILCDYEQFLQITSKYSIDEATWRERCQYTDDLVINDSSFG